MRGRVTIEYTKWDGRLHWHFELDVLGEDEHGWWLAARPGCVMQRGNEPPHTQEAGVACLVPHAGRWIAYFNLNDDPSVYIDVTDVPVARDGVVHAIDLDLDVVRLADGTVFIDDEDEFVEHQALFGYPADVVAATRVTADELAEAVRARREPFGDAPRRWMALVAQGHYDTRAIRRAYDAFPGGAAEYAERFGDDILHHDGDRAIVDEAVRGAARVLDLGCGPGQIASYAKGIGVDLTIDMLSVARARDAALPLVNGDILALPFASSSFDAAVARYSLHNLPRSVLPVAITEVARVMRTGGTLLVTTHGGAGQTEVPYNGPNGLATVLMTYYSLDELAEAARSAGLSEVRRFDRAPEAHEHQAPKISLLASKK